MILLLFFRCFYNLADIVFFFYIYYKVSLFRGYQLIKIDIFKAIWAVYPFFFHACFSESFGFEEVNASFIIFNDIAV